MHSPTGWGTSFHFAHRWRGESHGESIRRHEHYLALRLGLKPGDKVLDVGCGIGGPLREIALFSGAHITGGCLEGQGTVASRG
jgi:sterol 24-C-methyltransferase